MVRYLNAVANLRKSLNLSESSISASLTLANADAKSDTGDRLVRLRCSADSQQTYSGWFAVRDLPWQKTAITVVWFVCESLIFWICWLVYRRRPEDDSAALFFLSCILAVGAYVGGHHWLQLTGSPGLIFVFAMCAMALPQVNLHFYLVFPTPKRFVLRHPQIMLIMLYGLPALVQLGILWTIGSVVSTFRLAHDDAATIERHLSTLQMLVWVYAALSVIMFAGCVAAVLHSYRTARH